MRLLMALMLCVFALLVGCDQAMRQPITHIVTPTHGSLEKAQAAMERVNERTDRGTPKSRGSRRFSYRVHYL